MSGSFTLTPVVPSTYSWIHRPWIMNSPSESSVVPSTPNIPTNGCSFTTDQNVPQTPVSIRTSQRNATPVGLHWMTSEPEPVALALDGTQQYQNSPDQCVPCGLPVLMQQCEGPERQEQEDVCEKMNTESTTTSHRCVLSSNQRESILPDKTTSQSEQGSSEVMKGLYRDGGRPRRLSLDKNKRSLCLVDQKRGMDTAQSGAGPSTSLSNVPEKLNYSTVIEPSPSSDRSPSQSRNLDTKKTNENETKLYSAQSSIQSSTPLLQKVMTSSFTKQQLLVSSSSVRIRHGARPGRPAARSHRQINEDPSSPYPSFRVDTMPKVPAAVSVPFSSINASPVEGHTDEARPMGVGAAGVALAVSSAPSRLSGHCPLVTVGLVQTTDTICGANQSVDDLTDTWFTPIQVCSQLELFAGDDIFA